MSAKETNKKGNNLVQLPFLPLRDVVLFPHMVIPLFVGRPKSIAALQTAMDEDGLLMVATQKAAVQEDPVQTDIYDIGCVCKILQMLALPDGTVKVLVEATQRVRMVTLENGTNHFWAHAEVVESTDADGMEVEALSRAAREEYNKYIEANKKLPPELRSSLEGIEDTVRLVDTMAAHLNTKIATKQDLLAILSVKERYEALLAHLEGELDIAQVERRIRTTVKRQMEKSQRDFYLSEQMKAIQKELGDTEQDDLDELEKKLEAAGLSKEAKEKAQAELKKLKMMSGSSSEATVSRNYLETMASLPWKKKSKVNNDLARAEKVLDDEHHGLDKVKERIVEYLAVQQRVDKLKAPILCFVGPPGVGKTSLGESIARATGRKYVRMALGGVRDESEVRGHRRTYIGALPGKILQNLAKVGTRNPLFLLDEIDKMGSDHRGDPAAALLEVLDPAQNHTFSDHYLEVDFDLSDVMFVATSNSYNIPAPLLDRMEVIRLSGYTEDEKLSIATRHLLPKQIKNNGLKLGEIDIDESAVRDIVRYYTREAGVRSLDREVSKICRKVVKMLLLKKGEKSVKVTSENLDKFLGVRRFDFGVAEKENQVGEVTGLAWTEVGGELLTIEAVSMPGKGGIIRTGTLGDVMKESIEAARTVVRSRSKKLGIKSDLFDKVDMHIHVPEGATPKDGPSAGIAMTTAMVSIFTGIPVRADVAMTGEVTLRGEVLPIGGLKEKLLAARRGGIKTVLIPEQNAKDLAEIPDNVKADLDIIPVRWIDKVLEIALERLPTPLPEGEGATVAAAPAEGDLRVH